jgi:hypothetical protein
LNGRFRAASVASYTKKQGTVSTHVKLPNRATRRNRTRNQPLTRRLLYQIELVWRIPYPFIASGGSHTCGSHVLHGVPRKQESDTGVSNPYLLGGSQSRCQLRQYRVGTIGFEPMRIGFQPIALPTELNPVDCGTGIEPVIPGSRPGVLPLNEPQSAVLWIRTREPELMRLSVNAST